MKRALFYLLMVSMTFTACNKNGDDEQEMEKVPIEEVLRLDDILYFLGDTVDVDFMNAQYEKMGYQSYSYDMISPVSDLTLAAKISYRNEQHNSIITIGYSLVDYCCYVSSYYSYLFTYDMKDDVIQYINKRYGVILTQKEDYVPDANNTECYVCLNNDGFPEISLYVNDKLCCFLTSMYSTIHQSDSESIGQK